METITTNKYSIQGVHRLKLSNPDLRRWVESLGFKDLAYIIVTEKEGTDSEHVHFFFSSSSRTLNVHNFRKMFKNIYSDLLPDTIKNGVLNISKVINPVRMCIYLCKEGYPKIHSSNLSIDFMRDCTRKAFAKEVSMTSAITKLKNTCINGEITQEEYIVQYRLLRNKYMKPDPEWIKEARKISEITKDEEFIRKEVRDYFSNNYLWD